MRRKALVVFAFIAASLFIPGLVLPALGAAVATYAYESYSRRRNARIEGGQPASRVDRLLDRIAGKREKRRFEEQKLEARRSQAVEYSPETGWDLSVLPADMKGDLRYGGPDEAAFTCAGIHNLVKGRADGKDVIYSFRVNDAAKAEELRKKAQMFNGSVLVSVPSTGGVEVTAYNARAINEMAKAAFPSKTVKVERENTVSSDYLIDGCRSYEEALERFRRDRESLVPVRTEMLSKVTVDGEVIREDKATPVPFTMLRAGSYVINDSVVSHAEGEVTVPGNIPEDLVGFHAGDALVLEKGDTHNEEIQSDVTPKDVIRTFVDEDGHSLVLASADSPELASLKSYVICKDADALNGLFNGNGLKGGDFVIVEKDLPAPGPGEFVVELEREDGDIRSLLAVQGDASPAFAARCESLGVSKEDLAASRLSENVAVDGYDTLLLKEDVGLDRLKVNGIRVMDIRDRILNERLEKLGREHIRQWLDDANRIQSINITVDAKKAELRITTVTDSAQRTEVRKMTEDEMRSFSKRCAVSSSEMKDFYMQLHPDLFKTYSEAGLGTVQNPTEAFLRGEKPKMNEPAEKAAAKKEEVVKQQKAVQKQKKEKRKTSQSLRRRKA